MSSVTKLVSARPVHTPHSTNGTGKFKLATRLEAGNMEATCDVTGRSHVLADLVMLVSSFDLTLSIFVLNTHHRSIALPPDRHH